MAPFPDSPLPAAAPAPLDRPTSLFLSFAMFTAVCRRALRAPTGAHHGAEVVKLNERRPNNSVMAVLLSQPSVREIAFIFDNFMIYV